MSFLSKQRTRFSNFVSLFVAEIKSNFMDVVVAVVAISIVSFLIGKITMPVDAMLRSVFTIVTYFGPVAVLVATVVELDFSERFFNAIRAVKVASSGLAAYCLCLWVIGNKGDAIKAHVLAHPEKFIALLLAVLVLFLLVRLIKLFSAERVT